MDFWAATYSTRLFSFSVVFISLTRAAALSEGVALMSHTVVLARGPRAQSGNWKPSATLMKPLAAVRRAM